jgi:hypothetical protein
MFDAPDSCPARLTYLVLSERSERSERSDLSERSVAAATKGATQAIANIAAMIFFIETMMLLIPPHYTRFTIAQ